MWDKLSLKSEEIRKILVEFIHEKNFLLFMISRIFLLIQFCDKKEVEVCESHVIGNPILLLLVLSDVENELDQQLFYELFSEKFSNLLYSRH